MSNETNNPYQAYYNAMLDMQKEMANAYFAAQQNGQWDPNMPPPMGMPPFMMHGQPMHPQFMHPGMMPPHMAHPGMPPQYNQANAPQTPQPEEENNALFEQAQAMLDGALGEEANTFKEILGSFGMSDKEFWKGAMVGAAAALILSNDNVRGKLMGLVSGAGDMLKNGGEAVRDSAANTASSVKENVSTGSEIFKDTYQAGKQGYQDSVQKHKAEPVIKPLKPGQEPTAPTTDADTPAIQEQ
ncbi:MULTISPECIES: YtxH domain-containing protein [unclassified Vibrio]|uniref:YtxH domain-containing protein n=1 Tax=unclassified Vibrio TaxID=2614977 RepID=UPI0025563BC9|nr:MULTISPECIES: YtxH domain-containing protein [unclassified Vibrio]